MTDVAGPFKIVLLGEGRAGKTSLVSRYVRKKFDPHEKSSTNAAGVETRVKIGSTTVRLTIWDTAGQERYHALAPIYYRQAHGALIVYDITDMDSWVRVRKWAHELQVMDTNCAIAIAGNKSDLHHQARVQPMDVEEYVRSIGAKHFTVSAKLDQGVEAVFAQLATDVLQRQATSGRQGGGGSFHLVADEEHPPQRVRKRDKCFAFFGAESV